MTFKIFLFFVFISNSLWAQSILKATNKFSVVPREYVVKLKKGFTGFLLSNDFRIKEKISDDLLVINFLSDDTKKLKKNSPFEIIEPNYIYKINLQPNDPLFAQSWGLENNGDFDSKERKGLSGIDIGATKAWEITTGTPEMIVAIIDTGIDFSSPDLKSNAWVNELELNGKPGVDDDDNGYIDDLNGYDFLNNRGQVIDDHGHGTHVAGVIGAAGDNGIGIAGINWKVRLMSLKFLDATGTGNLAAAIKAIRYAILMKAKISNNSWGGGGFSEILQETIKEANQAQMLFVTAAGNLGTNSDLMPEYPASYNFPNVISVAAINNRGQLSSFSNFGATSVHLAAPGENILSTLPNGKYDSWSGTSMAAPFVSGAAALLWGNQPHLSMNQVKARILSTAAPLPALKGRTISGGMLDLDAALKK